MALKWKKNDLMTLAEKKVQMANETCQSLIYAGIDVQLTTGQEHFSLEPNDQTNIDSMFTAVTLGATQYPYHSDGAQCKMYSAVDIVTLYVAYKTFVTKQTTYCNFLKIWGEPGDRQGRAGRHHLRQRASERPERRDGGDPDRSGCRDPGHHRERCSRRWRRNPS